MKRKDVNELRHGFYELFWKSGGSSFAAVGSTNDGVRWFAPTNWTTNNHANPMVASTNWRLVGSADPFITQ